MWHGSIPPLGYSLNRPSSRQMLKNRSATDCNIGSSGFMPSSSNINAQLYAEKAPPLASRLSGVVQKSAPRSCLWDIIMSISARYCLETAILLPHFVVYKATDNMVVNHANGLHIGVDNGRAHKFETQLL